MTDQPQQRRAQAQRPSNRTTTGTATSRLGLMRHAQLKKAKARLSLSGPAGSGKTWTALTLAEELVRDTGETIMLIDTEPSDDENTAAELYASYFDFDLVQWLPPYDPRDLAATLKHASAEKRAGNLKLGCVIIDSATHFWTGEGGTLDMADGRFGGWKEATPAQNDMVDAILRSSFHVICCTRAKQAHAQQTDAQGRVSVVKLGLEAVQRGDLEYEFQVCGVMGMDHTIEIGKTRCAQLAGKKFHANHQGDLAKTLKEWLDGGVELIRQSDADDLVRAMNAMPDRQARAVVKDQFRQEFNVPSQVPLERLEEAWAWLKERHVEYVAPGEPGEPPAVTPNAATPTSAGDGPAQTTTGGNGAEPAAPAQAPAQVADPPETIGDVMAAAAAEPKPEPSDFTAVCAYVDGMTKRAVVAELARRGQPTNGAESALKSRLVDALVEEGFVVPQGTL